MESLNNFIDSLMYPNDEINTNKRATSKDYKNASKKILKDIKKENSFVYISDDTTIMLGNGNKVIAYLMFGIYAFYDNTSNKNRKYIKEALEYLLNEELKEE